MPVVPSENERVDAAVPLIDGLNPDQLDAVVHTDGPLLVVAGAGSGKTRVLTHRIAHLVGEHGVNPMRILAITFTNKAADEMRERVASLVGPVARKMWVSTFHSACVRILRREAAAIGYPSSFSIYDQADAQRLTGYVIRDLALDPKRFTPKGVHAQISQYKNDLIFAAEARERAANIFERKIADIYTEYQARLVKAGAMDFDDLLTNAVRLFREHPDVLEQYQERFEHILVDEYQDTNRAQNELILTLGALHRNVCVVGDSDQSIYRFRGADLRNILEFEEAFPDVTVIVLEQNYRSTQTILDAANAVIDHNSARKPKHLWTDQGQGPRIVRYHAEDEGDEARWVVAHPGRPARAGGLPLGRHGHLLPDQRPEPGGGGGPHAGRLALQGRRRHPLLRPPGDQGRPRLPAGGREPGRRGQRQAGAQRPQARRRRDVGGPVRRLRRPPRASPSPRRCDGPTRSASRAPRPGASRPSSSCWTTWRRSSRRVPGTCSRARSRPAATWPSWRPSTPSRPRAGWRTWASWSARPGSSPRWPSSWSRSRWWPTATRSTATRAGSS